MGALKGKSGKRRCRWCGRWTGGEGEFCGVELRTAVGLRWGRRRGAVKRVDFIVAVRGECENG